MDFAYDSMTLDLIERMNGLISDAVHPAEAVEVAKFLEPRMAYCMMPRYVRVVDELPTTETAKMQKAALRGLGLTADTWDREVAGVEVTR